MQHISTYNCTPHQISKAFPFFWSNVYCNYISLRVTAICNSLNLIPLWGTKGLFYGQGALCLEGLEPEYYSIHSTDQNTEIHSLNQWIFKKILKNLIYIKFDVLGHSHLSTIPICPLLPACARPSVSIFIRMILIKEHKNIHFTSINL